MWLPFILLLLPFLAHAEESPILKQLEGEPATMLDIGMIRLDNLTREFETRVGMGWSAADGTQHSFQPDVNSYYDVKGEKIVINFLAMNSVATDGQMKDGCHEAMGQMTIWILKELPGLFMHTGFDNTDESATQPLASISDMFELTCYISAADDSSVGRFWARRALKDPELEIGPWTLEEKP